MFGSTVQELARILIKANHPENEIDGKEAARYADDKKQDRDYWRLPERGRNRARYEPVSALA